MNIRRSAAVLAAAVVIPLSGIGAGTALAATPVTPITPITPVTPVTPDHPVTPAHGGSGHHAASTPATPSGAAPVWPLLLGGLGIAVAAGGGAYALARGGAADREREHRADVRVVPAPPVYHGYDQPPYAHDVRPYATPRHR